MVDVGSKPVTSRTAIAEGRVRVSPRTLALITSGKMPKGDVVATARLAGIMAAKRTGELIPLCHPLGLDSVEIDFHVGTDEVQITATARVAARTGVEMEALTAVAVAALTLYDMCKSVDKAMTIDGIRLLVKTGGSSGEYRAKPARTVKKNPTSPSRSPAKVPATTKLARRRPST